MTFRSMHQAMTALKHGKVSASKLYEQCAEQINKYKHLNAIITTNAEAKQQAEKACSRVMNGKPLSVLDGLPFAVKDNFNTKDMETTCASRMLLQYKPPYTATVVQRALDSGAVLMGKTNLDEFAMGCGGTDSVFGPIKNPWTYHTQNKQIKDDFYISGGSSGGSAVAVATGMAYAALGSDTGGSCRIPASFCGVVGVKPTYGKLSRHGLIPLCNSFDAPGVLTRSVGDAVDVLNILSGRDSLDSTSLASPQITQPSQSHDASAFHIGIPDEFYLPELSKDMLEVWNNTADMLERAGAKVTRVSMPNVNYSIAVYNVISACDIASNMARYDGVEFGHRIAGKESTESMYAHSRSEGFNDIVRGRILAGNYFLLRKQYEKYFVKARQTQRLIIEDFKRVFSSGVNVLLTPTTICDAPLHSEFMKIDSQSRCAEYDTYTQCVNNAGLPAVSLPAGQSSNGLPLGIQVIAPSFHEEVMLKVAYFIEQNTTLPVLEMQ